MVVIERCFPQWRQMIVHESSPGGRGASDRLASEASEYIPSHYFQSNTPGEIVRGFRNENLESLSFSAETIGLHVSQDVFEHVFNPAAAFQEIARTLQPGGAHVFTVPLVRKGEPTRRRASLNSDGSITHHQPPQYHGNPIDNNGSLVTIDWGYDICENIARSCGLHTEVHHIDDLSQGIRAEYIEVLVTRKPYSASGNSDDFNNEI
jgi:SAM-dependent methyltransferase